LVAAVAVGVAELVSERIGDRGLGRVATSATRGQRS
jgi:hypothetical protein